MEDPIAQSAPSATKAKPGTGKRRFPWRALRRVVQLAGLALFVVLLRKTELGPAGQLTPGTNFWFRIDPLVAASAMAAGRVLLWTLWPAAILLLATILFGRFFCGWICPMGTVLDISRRIVGRKTKAKKQETGDKEQDQAPTRWRLAGIKYGLLVVILIGAALQLELVGYFDPFSLLTRALALDVDPALSRGATGASTWLYLHAPSWITAVSEPVYAFLRSYILAFTQNPSWSAWAGVSIGILAVLILLERWQPRFWCRNLCPLGAMLGACSRWSLLRRVPAKACAGCQECAHACRMDAFDAQRRLSNSSCTLCMDCNTDCPKSIARWVLRWPWRTAGHPALQHATFDLSRRGFLTSCAVGAALPAMAAAAGYIGKDEKTGRAILRPPGVLEGDEFLDRCVRCGLCMKVCPTHGLQPTLLESGVEGAFSPRLIPRIGYCEYDCTLCGDVCPTGAITRVADRNEKFARKIGLAHFDKTRCLPYATGESCLCCEEHCPVPEKAIRCDEVEITNAQGEKVKVLQPRVVHRLCIGCGICENKCPIEGPAGIRVEPDDGQHDGGQQRRRQGRGQGQSQGRGYRGGRT